MQAATLSSQIQLHIFLILSMNSLYLQRATPENLNNKKWEYSSLVIPHLVHPLKYPLIFLFVAVVCLPGCLPLHNLYELITKHSFKYWNWSLWEGAGTEPPEASPRFQTCVMFPPQNQDMQMGSDCCSHWLWGPIFFFFYHPAPASLFRDHCVPGWIQTTKAPTCHYVAGQRLRFRAAHGPLISGEWIFIRGWEALGLRGK